MAKQFLILMAGMATAIVAVTGCTQSAPNASAPEQPPTEDTATADAPAAQTEFRVVENPTLPAPGADPLAMIVSVRQAPGEPIGSEQIRVTYPAQDKAIVTVTQSGLPDDSVKAIRTRYELAPAEGSANGTTQWKVTQVTQQNRCQAGRGSEGWTGDLCK
ncbi:hypothetical protein [Leptolyngbya ohadii]|uniref:hypothetical protein n=1 Tax=Leptolyngbya ohadii TaxID=1962290 RepID=UPI000B5A013C|nr:hypothetical protein [Leptolyngbya ohadii]